MEDFIYLEPDEEIPSLVKKLRKAKADSVGLVVPRGSITLQSAINLKLLKTEAAKLHKDIAIVSTDPIGQNLATQAGLTVYETVKSKQPIEAKRPKEGERPAKPDLVADSAYVATSAKEAALAKEAGVTVRHFQTETIEPEKQYRPPERTAEGPTPGRRTRATIALVVVLLLVALLYLFVVPRVVIVIEVLGEPFEKELALKAATVSGPAEQVVAATLEEDSNEVSKTFKTTGQKNVGEKAKGTITLFNAWSSDPQPLAQASKLTKDGQTFRLLQAVTIPGASVTLVAGQAQTNPGKTEAQIEAEAAGEQGNVGPGKFTISSIELIKQSKIYGESTSKLTGGSSRFIGVVSEDDLKNARQTIEAELKTQLKEELVSKVAGRIVLDQAVRLDVVEEKISRKQDEEASEFEIQLRGNLKAIVFTESEFRKAFLQELNQEIGDDREVVFGPNDEITTTVEEADFENGRLTLRGLLKSQIAPKIDQGAIKQTIRFKSFVGAEKLIRDLPQVAHVEIAITPSFALKRIPLLGTNVKFEIKHK